MALTNSDFSALPRVADIEALWQLEEASPNDRIDQSDNGNDLSDNNTVQNAAAKIGDGASFTAANLEHLSIAGGALTGINSTTFTITWWVDMATPSQMSIIGGSAAGNRQIVINADGTIQLIKAGVIGVGTSTGPIGESTLTHCGCSYDTTNFAFYIDGVPTGSGANAQVLGYGDFFVGQSNGGTYLTGIVDELIHWSAILTPAQVIQVFNIQTQAQYKKKALAGFSGTSNKNWIFMKEAWDRNKEFWTPKIWTPKTAW